MLNLTMNKIALKKMYVNKFGSTRPGAGKNTTEKKKILFLCGSKNQTTQMHKIALHLMDDYDCYFSNLYADGLINFLAIIGDVMERSVYGKGQQKKNAAYFEEHGLKNDFKGLSNDYDLVFSSHDISEQKNLANTKMILVQEGIFEPMDWRYYVAKYLRLPRYLADTAMVGLSDRYNVFCVMSDGYKDELIRRGADPKKILVTGVPNFDHIDLFRKNDFPHKDYVLAVTCNHRETKRPDDRMGFIQKVKDYANGKQIIFKLHPMEDHERATLEIKSILPNCLIYTNGSAEEMIANCSMMITTYSSTILTASALEKPIISHYTSQQLKALKPVQTNGTSASKIANVAKALLTTV